MLTPTEMREARIWKRTCRLCGFWVCECPVYRHVDSGWIERRRRIMGIEETDKEAGAIAAKTGKPRISLDYIKSEIRETVYVTADYFLSTRHAPLELIDRLKVVTICMLVMRNGFVSIGKSAPISVDNFDSELGRKLAYEDALRPLWPMFAFMHKQAEVDGLIDADRAFGQPHRGHDG